MCITRFDNIYIGLTSHYTSIVIKFCLGEAARKSFNMRGLLPSY